MRDSSRNKTYGGRGRSNDRGGSNRGRDDRGGNDRGRDDRGGEMHKTICDDCGRSCEVPFKPSGNKPVYCNSCFKPQREDSGRGGRDDRGGRDNRREDRQMHKATCDDCGERCEVPFKPSGDKPIYCSACFGKGDSSGKKDRFSKGDFSSSSKPEYSNKKHDEINAKLDKILALLQGVNLDKKATATKVVKEEAPKKETVKKPTAKKETIKKETKKAAPKKAEKGEAPKKVPAKKTAAKKEIVKKAAPKKAAVKKAPAKKAATKKTTK